jgi:hypothetical protein
MIQNIVFSSFSSCYSDLKASIGLRLAALYAGNSPKVTPTPKEIPKEISIQGIEYTSGTSLNPPMIKCIMDIPTATPRIPPNPVRIIASIRN